MNKPRRVLLADPILFSHSLLYYKAALASTGYDAAEFVLITQALHEADKERLLEFASAEPRLKVNIVDVLNRECEKRHQSWPAFARSINLVEQTLRRESFDVVAYLYLDLALVFFALPLFRPWLGAHYRTKVAGLLFRDNGLRPASNSKRLSARLKNSLDLHLLRRALHQGALRRVAFLDPWCADRARAQFNCKICTYGIDPVFHRAFDPALARSQLGIAGDDFVILFFGTMSERKNVLECVSILRQMSLPRQTTLLIAGPATRDYKEPLEAELAAAAVNYRIIHHDRFIADAELPPYFAAADCVVCVYKNFSGSSSVLLHAAIFGKASLVSGGGAMEEAVKRYQIGEVVDVRDPKAFISALQNLASMDQSSKTSLAERAQAYGRSMDAHRFMTQFE